MTENMQINVALYLLKALKQEDVEHVFLVPGSIVTTLRAKGLIAEAHPLSFGFFGIGGTLQAKR